ncbi:MAG: hypothetical protein LBE17_05215 [Treponema sp.]|jgi:hypothetical protein|nr:hypothetical protein [Treponema sp.]
MGDTTVQSREPPRGVTFEQVWALIQETDRQLKETALQFKEMGAETDRRMQETDRRIKETQRIVGDLGNRFGDIAEQMLVPDLVDKFEQFGFSFRKLNRNVRWKEKEHNLSMEHDAVLENGTQVMIVEVKSKLNTVDIDEQIRRMEEVRRYADLEGDTRQFFCAIAALTGLDRVIKYALSNGLYLIMPSGEDVVVTKPASEPRIW